MKAIWKGTTIAKSEEVEEIEGNFYFPMDAVYKEFLLESKTRSSCPWKGQATYFHVMVDGEVIEDAAWSYPSPKEGAEILENRVAFWKGVQVKESTKRINFELLKVLNSFF